MIGQTISHYQILEKLGEGGMGVVYKAHDTKLDRMVALKFLPSQLAASEQDKARFIQEAKAAAALNHPNVCSIIDIQEHDGQTFMVMEFVDGQTLREKFGTISQKQAIDIGIQIADGLAAAHEKGIVHRDIKPENIMIRKDGIAQVMDFGLAKLRASGSRITRLTKAGSTVGTAGYMSPEQIQGQEADHRSDIFSLGVLLYELFTGELPFKGVHETALAYEIVNVDPAPMSVIRPALDPALDAIVLECLAKEPPERYQSVAEVAKELRRFKRESSRKSVSRITAVRSGAQVPAVMPPVGPGTYSAAGTAEYTALSSAAGASRRTILPWSVAAVLLVIAAWFGWRNFATVPPAQEEIRLNIIPPPGGSINNSFGGNSAISPDGRTVVFLAADSAGKNFLYVRPLRELTARRLQGTEGAYYPFWSPDNKSIGFFANGKMKKIDVIGGSSLTICSAFDGRGATWGREGVIVFAGGPNSGLSGVSAAGGEPAPATTLDTSRGQATHRWPYFLPDGKHFLFLSRTARGAGIDGGGELNIGSLDSPEHQPVMKASSIAEYADGYIYYVVENSLMARAFDPVKLTLEGDPFTIAEQLLFSTNMAKGDFSVSEAGDILYGTGASTEDRFLKWYDRNGKELSTVGDPAAYIGLQLSPDGKRVALEEYNGAAANRDLWIYDLERGTKSRLTFSADPDRTPVWSPDGALIYYMSGTDIFKKNTNGIGAEIPVLKSDALKRPYSISPDGGTLFYYHRKNDGTDDVYSVNVNDKPVETAVLADNFDKDNPRISPDGKWLAYCSNETGTYQVYVVPYPPTGGRYQVSTSEASFPFWNQNGKELFYLVGEGQLVSTAVESKGGVLRLGQTETLFRARLFVLTENPFAVSPDGTRFLCIVERGGDEKDVLTVIRNWPRPAGN